MSWLRARTLACLHVACMHHSPGFRRLCRCSYQDGVRVGIVGMAGGLAATAVPGGAESLTGLDSFTRNAPRRPPERLIEMATALTHRPLPRLVADLQIWEGSNVSAVHSAPPAGGRARVTAPHASRLPVALLDAGRPLVRMPATEDVAGHAVSGGLAEAPIAANWSDLELWSALIDDSAVSLKVGSLPASQIKHGALSPSQVAALAADPPALPEFPEWMLAMVDATKRPRAARSSLLADLLGDLLQDLGAEDDPSVAPADAQVSGVGSSSSSSSSSVDDSVVGSQPGTQGAAADAPAAVPVVDDDGEVSSAGVSGDTPDAESGTTSFDTVTGASGDTPEAESGTASDDSVSGVSGGTPDAKSGTASDDGTANSGQGEALPPSPQVQNVTTQATSKTLFQLLEETYDVGVADLLFHRGVWCASGVGVAVPPVPVHATANQTETPVVAVRQCVPSEVLAALAAANVSSWERHVQEARQSLAVMYYLLSTLEDPDASSNLVVHTYTPRKRSSRKGDDGSDTGSSGGMATASATTTTATTVVTPPSDVVTTAPAPVGTTTVVESGGDGTPAESQQPPTASAMGVGTDGHAEPVSTQQQPFAASSGDVPGSSGDDSVDAPMDVGSDDLDAVVEELASTLADTFVEFIAIAEVGTIAESNDNATVEERPWSHLALSAADTVLAYVPWASDFANHYMRATTPGGRHLVVGHGTTAASDAVVMAQELSNMHLSRAR